MNQEQHIALRAPFPLSSIGKLPRVTCRACRDAPGKVCERHTKSKCGDCDNYITTAHIHLDYVGHADLTDRLLQVDPEWSWEPMGTDERGAPLIDGNGGLWIRLTVAGVTRIGYGHPDGKRGGDAIKEAIGDALRNAAMRFGVALDLWRKEPAQTDDERLSRQPSRPPSQTENSAAADVARDLLLTLCRSMKIDPSVVAQAYHAGWNVRLHDETDADRIVSFTAKIRDGFTPAEGTAA